MSTKEKVESLIDQGINYVYYPNCAGLTFEQLLDQPRWHAKDIKEVSINVASEKGCEEGDLDIDSYQVYDLSEELENIKYDGLKQSSSNDSILDLTYMVRNFYENSCSKTLVSGYEKNVLARFDSQSCLFVNSEYELQEGDVIFRCKTINRNTVIDLYKTYVSPLSKLFTEDEWKEILYSMNGIMVIPEVDVRDQIAGEVEGTIPEAAKKISALSLKDGEQLNELIKKFWDHQIGYDYFKKLAK